MNTHHGDRILWGWTAFNAFLFTSWTAAKLLYFALALVTTIIVSLLAFMFWEETYKFSQPRDALDHAPIYVQVHEDAERYCLTRCSQDQLDLFLQVRDKALTSGWPKLLDVTMQNWRWHKHMSLDYNMGWTIRDDFFTLIESIGGRTAAAQCTPIVRWTVRSTYIQDSFRGLMCDGKEYLLTY
jgi:hypothetical protein